MNKAESCITQEQEQTVGLPGALPARLLVPCVEQISHVAVGHFIVELRLSSQQTEVLEIGEKMISMNLHFPSTPGEDSQLVLQPLLAGTWIYIETHLWQQPHW